MNLTQVTGNIGSVMHYFACIHGTSVKDVYTLKSLHTHIWFLRKRSTYTLWCSMSKINKTCFPVLCFRLFFFYLFEGVICKHKYKSNTLELGSILATKPLLRILSPHTYLKPSVVARFVWPVTQACWKHVCSCNLSVLVRWENKFSIHVSELITSVKKVCLYILPILKPYHGPILE